MPDFSNSEEWYLAVTVHRGIGQCWSVTAYSLSEVEPGETHQAASTLAAAKRWAREQIGLGPGAVKWEERSPRLLFGYCLRKHVESMNAEHALLFSPSSEA